MRFFTDRADLLAAMFAVDFWFWVVLIAMLAAIVASACEFLAGHPFRGWAWALVGAALFLLAPYVSQAEALSALLVTGPE